MFKRFSLFLVLVLLVLSFAAGAAYSKHQTIKQAAIVSAGAGSVLIDFDGQIHEYLY